MSTKDIIIGSVPYLNAKPLTRVLERRPDIYTFRHEPPSVLADLLKDDKVQVAILPVASFLGLPGMRYVPGVSISCRGPSESVRLYHRGPLEGVRTVGLDCASRSSNMLLRVLMHEHFRLSPEYVEVDPRRGTDALDAFVVIGDAALTLRLPDMEYIDLGTAWHDLTGLPFVFAVWGVKDGTDLQDVDAALADAVAPGLKEADDIAREESARLGVPEADVKRYLTQTMVYDLGEEELSGMEVFQGLAMQYGLVAEEVKIHAYEYASTG